MLHNVPRPVVGVHVALDMGIPLEFTANRRGMSPQRLGNLGLRGPIPSGLPDPFFVVEVLIR